MISIRSLRLQYGENIIFNDIDFVIKPNDKIGLIGRNGAGKTSLFRVLSGNLTPDYGQIEIPSGTRLSFLKQHLTIHSTRSVIQEVLSVVQSPEELNRNIENTRLKLEDPSKLTPEIQRNLIIQLAELHEQINQTQSLRAESEVILKGLGFSQDDLEHPLDQFSGGWKMRVELAKILIQKPNYLLLDEPTNYLDIESVIWFEKYLKSFPGSFMIVSHDQDFLDNCTDNTYELAEGELYFYNFSYSRALVERSERIHNQIAAQEQQQKLIHQKQRTIDRFRAKASKRNMVKSMEKQLSKMDLVTVDRHRFKDISIRFNEGPRAGEVVLETKNLSKSFGDHMVFSGVNLKVFRGQKIAVVGKNGEGKSTLIQVVAGNHPLSAGSFQLGYNVAPGYYFQDHPEKLEGEMTVFETMEAEAPPELYPRLRGILGAFLFSGDDVDKRVKVLSGGERSRLALATLLLNPYNLLMLDEPTNHLDIPSKEILKKALIEFKGSLIIVSHDRQFLRELTETTFEFNKGQIHEHLGGIDDFLHKKHAESFRDFESSDTSNKVLPENESKSKGRSDREIDKKLKRHIHSIERQIEKLEKQIDDMEVQMAEEGFYEDPDHKNQVDSYHSLREELADKYEEWDKLADQIS